MPLTHVKEDGSVSMVDVSAKPETDRIAIAEGTIVMQKETFQAIKEKQIKKGDVLCTAQIAGIMAAKETSRIIPLCHPIPLSHVAVDWTLNESENTITCRCTTRTCAQTGVEMEALIGCSAALLTIYDMCKAMEHGMHIEHIHLVMKDGGRSGLYTA